MNSRWTGSVIAACLLHTGCLVGPNYRRPAVTVPVQYRGATPAPNPSSAPVQDFAEMQWWTVFEDQALQSLIREAFDHNYDLRIAANRVLQAESQLGITRADQLPAVSASGELALQRSPTVRPAKTFQTVGAQLSWTLDFWGQFRRATESARDTLLATEYARQAVRLSLISSVASSYFQLRAFDQQLAASKRILQVNQETLRIATVSVDGGISPITDELQAKLLVQQAEAQITQLDQSIAQAQNQLSILLGRDPGDVIRGRSVMDQPHWPEIPIGLPSQLLERRPDIRRAEAELAAANADIGVARAAYFPQIPLTAALGVSSTAFTNLLNSHSTIATVAGQAIQPIVTGGRLSNTYKLAQERRDAAELLYRQSIQQALADVANTLVGYTQSRQYREKQQERTATYAEAARLANLRYRQGATSFLEVLTTQQQLLTAEIETAQSYYSELKNYTDLYLALGGGWQL